MQHVTVKLTRSETESVQLGMPAWEVPVLQMVHGPERVEILEKVEYLDREYPDANSEFDRLQKRYKVDMDTGTPFVVMVYGHPASGIPKLEELIAKARRAEEAVKTVPVNSLERKTAKNRATVEAISE